MIPLKQQAKIARLKTLDMVYKAQSSHIGSHFSVIDMMTVLFNVVDHKKDKIILSAGWKAAPFYYFLSQAGFFPEEDLMTYNQEGSNLIGLTEPGVPGVLFAGGSMQMGVPAAVGFALSKKLKGEDGKVYCIMSDGELAGGMIWESLIIAHHHKLNNLIILVDYNGLQAMGKTVDVLDTRSVTGKFNAFGFASVEVNGHDMDRLEKWFRQIQSSVDPVVMICHTIKGKGVKFMENNNLFHYKNLSEEEYQKAKLELSC